MPNDCTAPSLAVSHDEQSPLVSGIHYNTIKMKNNQQLVKYKPRASSKALTVGALAALVTAKGEDWVIQQVVNGAMFLSRKASEWWASRTSVAAPTDIVSVPAPTSVGVAIRGNARLNGATRIKHRELVTTVTNNQTQIFRVNPVAGNTFPYLSTLATMYDQYTIHSLRFVVVSAMSTTEAGRWYMAWDTDSSDASPESLAAFMAMQHSVSMSAWQSGALTVPSSKTLLTTPFPDALKDHGQFFFAYSGSNVSPTFDLYVEYDVSLTEPNVTSPSMVVGTSFENLIASGTLPVHYGAELIQPLSVPTAKKFLLAPGYYLVTALVTASSITAGSWTISSNGGFNSSILGQNATLNSAGTKLIRTLAIRVDSYGVIVNIGDAYGTLTSDRNHIAVCPISALAASTLGTTLGA